jgi:hypothetical protein
MVMNYPKIIEYKGCLIKEYDPQYQANSFQVCYMNGEPMGGLEKTLADAKAKIDDMDVSYYDES